MWAMPWLFWNHVERVGMTTRILVINDDQDLLELYEAILSEEGYDVMTSKLAFEHPAAIELLRPDLVMLDLKFGTQLEGWKMMQKLRLYRPTAGLPIIVCTAAVREAREQEDHLRSEGIGVVYKPFAIDQLVLAVQQTLAVTGAAARAATLEQPSQPPALVGSVNQAKTPLPAMRPAETGGV
jgi:DNA-binding response OmpR family regulator